jgi:DNA polymerase (family 10)
MSEYDHEDLNGVVQHLSDIAFFLRMDPDASHWQSNAYQDASEALENKSPEVLEDPRSVDGIGDSVGQVIDEFLEDGESQKLNYMTDKFPDVRELTRVEGLGVKTARRIYDNLEITTLDELEEACEKGLLADHVPRVGSTTEENFLEEIEEVRIGAQDRKPLEEVRSYWEGLETRLGRLQDEKFADLKGIDPIGRVTPAGSFRREKETVGDLDVLIEADPEDAEAIFKFIEGWRVCDKVLRMGTEKMSFRVDALQIDLLIVPTEMYGASLQYFTGDYRHNTALRDYAKNQGFTISEHGMFEYLGEDEDGSLIKGERVAGETEEEIYKKLGLPCPDPTERTEEWVKERI